MKQYVYVQDGVVGQDTGLSGFCGNPYTIVSGAVANSNPAYFTAGVANQVIVSGSATPLKYIFADTTQEIISSDLTVTGLTSSAVNYILKTLGSNTLISTTIKPARSYYQPPAVNGTYWLNMGVSPWQMELCSGGVYSPVSVIELGSVTLDGSGNITTFSPRNFNENIQEYWHYVGATGEPTFTNGWVNYGGNRQVARFRKGTDSNIYLEGSVKSGSAGTTVYILPTGYKPSLQVTFTSYNGSELCYVSSGGNVCVPYTNISTVNHIFSLL